MSFAKSLRVIGQSLEVAKVLEFKLEGDGRNFMLQSDSMSRTAEWMLRYAGRENDISPLAGRRSAADTPLESQNPWSLAMRTLSGLMLGKRNGGESFLPHGPSFQPRSCLNSYGFWATISTEAPREHFIFSGCAIR